MKETSRESNSLNNLEKGQFISKYSSSEDEHPQTHSIIHTVGESFSL